MAVLGIDLGTTWSCASYYTNGESKIALSPDGKTCIPSVIYFDSDQVLVGDSANTLKNTSFSEEIRSNLKFNFKGEMGASQESIQYSAHLLKYIKAYSEEYFNCEFTDVVITVPVYFSDQSRLATKEACILAGFENVLRIINEPTAAILAYNNKEESNVLVFDFGGGTTDFSLIQIDSLSCQVLETIGDLHLGGNDVTNLLVEYLYTLVKPSLKTEIEKSDYRKNKVLCKLREAAEDAKIKLSFLESTKVYIESFYQDVDFSAQVSRMKLEDICRPITNRLKELLKQIKSEYSKVVFIGGSSRIPFLRKMFDVDILDYLSPDTTVAQGAGIQGYNLVADDISDDIPLLLDSVSLTVGIELDGGIMGPIVSRGSTLPAKNTLEFRTAKDYESEYNVKFYQGECRFTKDNHYLGTLQLTNVSKAMRGQVLITLEVEISIDGLYSIVGYETKRKKETLQKLNLISDIESDFIETNLKHSMDNLFVDLILSEKRMLKLELFDKFMELLEIFRDRKELLMGDNEEDESFLMYKFDTIFTETKSVIENYTTFTVEELKNCIKKFKEAFYKALFTISKYDVEDGTFSTPVRLDE